ncbi:MAG: hydrogenase maturation nickel metallochaperone HypA [Acidobacteria bacterium]|nr:hydrogenase maturation nickel metallochaperone HypA [Acidobacteriota bacterium]
MHEVGIMQSVLEIAEAQARTSGALRIREVKMRVGRMTGVVSEALDHAFAVLREGTMAAGARLDVEFVPGAFWCMTCAAEFESDDLIGGCPTCHEPSFDMRRGRELDVVSLEVD